MRIEGFRVGVTRAILAVIATLLLVWQPAPSEGAETVPLMLTGDATHFPLDGHLEFLDDRDGRFSIADVVQSTDFIRKDRPGITSGVRWYRFTVQRAAGMPAQWVLAFGEPDMDDVRVYVPNDTGYALTQLGRRIPSSQLPMAALHHVAMLELPEAGPTIIHLRLASQHKIRFEQAALWRPSSLVFQEARQSAFDGFRLGVLAVIVLVYALFGLWLRDQPMLFYSLYVGTILSRAATHTGIAALLFPEAARATNYMLSGIGLLGGLAAFLLLWDRILNLKVNFPTMHRVYWLAGLTFATSTVFVGSSIFHIFAIGAHVGMLLASAGSIVMAAILVRRHPANHLLKFYLFAFAPFLMAWGAEVASAISPLVPADLGRQMNLFATMAHIGILSIALAYRLGQLQRERARAELALADEQLSRQRQRTFIDMATHEFKTPLAVIDSAVQVLGQLTAPARPEITDRIASVRRAVKRLVGLVDTCLAGDRIESMEADLQPMAPSDLVRRIVDRNRDPDMPDAAQLIVSTTGLPDTCRADPDLLTIALDTLIDNARRYGPRDQPIEVSAQADGGWVSFAVHDRGPGIDPGDQDRIFDKYFRGKSAGAIPGTGIGLHLVKTIAELHKGRVGYMPREGGGSSFILAIPA